MRILITGVTGFVGTNLLKYYQKQDDHELFGMVRNLNQTEKLQETPLKGIVTLGEVVSDFKYHVVIHLAGKAHDVKQVADRKEYFLSNEKLTIDLYNAFLDYNESSTFIFVSSVSVFSSGSDKPYTEKDIPHPTTPYGITKYYAENFICSQKIPADKRYYILRPSIIYGPNSKGNLNLLYKMVEKGIPYPLGSFRNKKSFLSVFNLCYILDQLTRKNIPSGIYHVADDEALSTVDVINIIYDSLGKRSKIINLPKWMIFLLAKFGDHVRILINSERLAKLTQNFLVSNQKIKKELGINLPENTYDGLKKTFRFYSYKKRVENNS